MAVMATLTVHKNAPHFCRIMLLLLVNWCHCFLMGFSSCITAH